MISDVRITFFLVAINLEMVLKLLSTIKDLERKIIDTKDFVPIVVSNIINLAMMVGTAAASKFSAATK